MSDGLQVAGCKLQDHFALFGLPRSFDINLQDLERRYFEAQRRFHPDRIAGKSTQERTQAISQSMQANAGYETLKSPLKRANYLLSLHGIMQDKTKPSQAVIMETMELREQLAETQDLQTLETMEKHNEKSRDAITLKLSAAFKEGNIPLAGELAIQLSYIYKMHGEIRHKKKTLKIIA
jgi:molecular chaperone HscB